MYKVCFVMPEVFPVPAVCGGAIETLIENLINQNEITPLINITVCCVRNKIAEEKVIMRGYKYTKFIWTSPDSKISKILNFIYSMGHKFFKKYFVEYRKHYREICDFLKKNRFDFVIIEGGDVICSNEMLKKIQCSNKIIHIHNHAEPLIEKDISYDYVIGVSDFITREYVNDCSKALKGYTLKNCIDIKKFQKKATDYECNSIRTKYSLYKDDFIVAFVGRIIAEKGVKELIEAILKISNPKVKLMIIGSTNFSSADLSKYELSVKECANKYPDKIFCVGYVPNKDLYKYLNIASVQCIPSMWDEAAGLVVLEAMAVGLPTIVSDSGGMIEYVTDKTSVIVERNNIVNGLVGAILSVLHDKDKRNEMKSYSLENVLQYNANYYLRNMVDILKDMNERE